MPLTRRHFVRTLFAASQATLLGRLLDGNLFADDTRPGALNFAVLGDWGHRGQFDQKQVADQMAIACEKAAASFVISVGDNFYTDGVASLTDSHWQESYENIYHAKSLQVPWYVILGNHDYRGQVEPQLQYGKTHPRWIMPARYYSHVYPIDASTKLECFFIDTSPFIKAYHIEPEMKAVLTQDTAPQLVWLNKALAASTADWKIVCGHHPIYSAGKFHGNQQEMIDILLPILQKNKVHAYFCGHDHDLQHLKTGDIDLFLSGGGFEHRDVTTTPEARFGKSTSGFAMASIRASDLQVNFIDNAGKLLYTATIQRVS